MPTPVRFPQYPLPAVVGGAGQSCGLTVRPRGTAHTGTGVGLHLGRVESASRAGILCVWLGAHRAVESWGAGLVTVVCGVHQAVVP